MSLSPRLSPPRPGAGLHVVVADDSAPIRAHLVGLFSALPAIRVIREVDSTPDVIEAVEALHPDVVVLDISMPGGNGILALEHIKRTHPDTLVIMLTNHSNDFYRKKCLAAGASYFFDKSSEFEKVEEVLQRLGRAASDGDS